VRLTNAAGRVNNGRFSSIVDTGVSHGFDRDREVDQGVCPTYRVGDSFTLKAGYQLVSDIPVCMHALSALMGEYKGVPLTEIKAVE